MAEYDHLHLLFAFLIIGFSTFLMRALFLYNLPEKFNKNLILRRGLESVPSSLLVALVIPYTFFSEGAFLPLRVEVLVILLSVLIIYFLKKPGLSLIIGIILLYAFDLIPLSI